MPWVRIASGIVAIAILSLIVLGGWYFNIGFGIIVYLGQLEVFDLFERATAREINNLRKRLRSDCDYHHLVGGRGHKNQYEEISSTLDYAAWEWHHPDYQDYRDHLETSNQRSAFSEDRFRIWGSGRDRDYTAEETRQGLWLSAIARGVANIWGHLVGSPSSGRFSLTRLQLAAAIVV